MARRDKYEIMIDMLKNANEWKSKYQLGREANVKREKSSEIYFDTLVSIGLLEERKVKSKNNVGNWRQYRNSEECREFLKCLNKSSIILDKLRKSLEQSKA
jgi:predicted transcriptional regulator